MGIFFTLLSFVFYVALVLVTAMHPVRAGRSRAELARQAKKTAAAKHDLAREERYAALATLLRSLRAVLLVAVAVTLVAALGWLWGVILAIVLAPLYAPLARLKVAQKGAGRLYGAIEPKLLVISLRFERILQGFREPSLALHEPERRLESREELGDIITASGEILSKNEQTILKSALLFGERTVDSVMTPRGVIDTINKGEFLGPLVLSELHKLGHSRLPVIDGDIDHVVGILHLRDLLSLDERHSSTAEKAMEQKVYYIHQDDTLEHALSAFLRTRHHLFMVINKNRETVGLLTLEDVIEALIGRRIVDQDDIHADLRAVAKREGAGNNNAADHVDI